MFVSPVVNVFPSFALHHVSFISHKSLRSWLMSAKKKKKTYQVRAHRERCPPVSAEYGTAEEDLNECLVRMGQFIRDNAGATHALSCGITDCDSNEARYVQQAQFFFSWLCCVLSCQFAVTHRQNTRRAQWRIVHTSHLIISCC